MKGPVTYLVESLLAGMRKMVHSRGLIYYGIEEVVRHVGKRLLDAESPVEDNYQVIQKFCEANVMSGTALVQV